MLVLFTVAILAQAPNGNRDGGVQISVCFVAKSLWHIDVNHT